MKRAIIRFANKAHRQPSPWVRRPAIVAAVFGLALLEIGFWLVTPVMVAFILIILPAKTFFEELIALPGLFINSAREDWREWQSNIAGAVRIWRAVKVEPVLKTKGDIS